MSSMPGSPAGPLVSIIVPVYNGAAYLSEALESALNQSYQNIEVIVVNDGSTDEGESEAIAHSYGSRITYISKENGGVASALNTGIRAMAGRYFSWLSADDTYYPHKIERQMELLRAMNWPVDIVLYSDFELMDAVSATLSIERVSRECREQIPFSLVGYSPVSGCTTLVPREMFDRIGLFDEKLLVTQDYDLWFRISMKHRFVHMPEVLVRSRVHEGQGSLKMAGHVQEEGSAFYISSIRTLSASGLKPPDRTMAITLMKIEFRLRFIGFPEAARVAGRLASDLCSRDLVEQVRYHVRRAREALLWYLRKLRLHLISRAAA